MANLMITYRCNLRCAYCFANSYVNRWDQDMSLETAGRMLDWLKNGGERMVGIMGGEPTVHPALDRILRMAAERGLRCSVFTNGLSLLPHLKAVAEVGARLLINVNEPQSLGPEAQRRFEETLERLAQLGLMRAVTFGVNIFRSDYDFSYHLALLKRWGQRELRVSVTVPNRPEPGMNPLTSLRAYAGSVERLCLALRDMGAFPSFDCNRLPACLLRETGLTALAETDSPLRRSNLWEGALPCQPVIDILPDETAIRCFGLSDQSRVRVADYQTPGHLRRHYLTQLDALGTFAPPGAACEGCYEHRAGLCQGGCLVYRMDRILALRQAVREGGALAHGG